MKILDILEKAAGAGSGLVDVLEKAKAAAPDLAGEIDGVLAKLGAAVDPANLVALAEAIPGEIANIAKGKIDPRDHPSDAA